LSRAVDKYKFKPQPLELGELVLFKSTLTPQGPIYERMYQADLGVEKFS
jgi:2'-5' RNA ligase